MIFKFLSLLDDEDADQEIEWEMQQLKNGGATATVSFLDLEMIRNLNIFNFQIAEVKQNNNGFEDIPSYAANLAATSQNDASVNDIGMSSLVTNLSKPENYETEGIRKRFMDRQDPPKTIWKDVSAQLLSFKDIEINFNFFPQDKIVSSTAFLFLKSDGFNGFLPIYRCSLESAREVHRRHRLEADSIIDDLVASKASIGRCNTEKDPQTDFFRFFQDMRGYVTDLRECLDHKVGPSILAI